MKTIEEVLNHYEVYQTDMEDRFGRRFVNFLTEEQAAQIGFALTEEAKKDGHTWGEPKAWTEENILDQLKKDVEFGWEKACDERGISSSLMHNVVQSWCKVLENDLADYDSYNPYGKPLFRAVAKLYGWSLHE